MERVQSFKALCVYLHTEQAYPGLFAILSATVTVSFASSNETKEKAGCLRRERGEPLSLCLSAAFQTCCSLFGAGLVQRGCQQKQ